MRTLIFVGLLALAFVACENELVPQAPEEPVKQSKLTSSAAADPHAAHTHDHDHDHGEVLATIPPPSGEAGVVDVYRSPTCGCCGKWIDHLRANGLKVNDYKVNSPVPVKQQFGLPRELGSCHSGVVDGYLVEGHVPASVVKRLIKERPDIKGVSVPAMPEGSPGMEGPNPVPYDVIAYTADGSASVYQHIPVE